MLRPASSSSIQLASDTAAKVWSFAQHWRINYPIVMATPEVISAYGGVPALPTTFVIDTQGRVVIHPRLRESAGMAGDVDVFGLVDHLDVWNHERFVSKMQREPYTDDDARALSEFGI